jgi:hypothetical protein
MKYLKRLLKVYTYQQLADRLGYKSRSTICNWVKTKNIPERVEKRLQQLLAELVPPMEEK